MLCATLAEDFSNLTVIANVMLILETQKQGKRLVVSEPNVIAFKFFVTISHLLRYMYALVL